MTINEKIAQVKYYLRLSLQSEELQDFKLQDENLLQIKSLIISAQSMIRLVEQRTIFLKSSAVIKNN